jgi:hypothetical protein
MLLGGRVDPRVVLKTHARLEIGAFEFGGLGRRWAPLCPFDPSGAGRLTRGAGAGSGPTWRFVNGQRLFLNTAFQIPGRCGCGAGGGGSDHGGGTRRAGLDGGGGKGGWGGGGGFPVTGWVGCRRRGKAFALLLGG